MSTRGGVLSDKLAIVVDEDEYEQRIVTELDEALRKNAAVGITRRLEKIAVVVDRCDEIMRHQNPTTRQYARAEHKKMTALSERNSLLATIDVDAQDLEIDPKIDVVSKLHTKADADLKIIVDKEDERGSLDAENNLTVEDDYDDDAYAERIIRYRACYFKEGVEQSKAGIRVEGTPWSIPASLHARLLPYQVEGVKWLLNRFQLGAGGILADEMVLQRHSDLFFCSLPVPFARFRFPFFFHLAIFSLRF